MSPRVATVISFLAVLGIALALRLPNLGTFTLWTDELFSLQSSAGRGFWVETLPRGVILSPAPNPTGLVDAGPVSGIYATQYTDTNPPVYYMILRVWREWFGSSDGMVRVPSLIASLVTVGAIFGAFRTTGTLVSATVAGLLAAVASTQIIYAHEARGYPVALALVSLAALAVFRIQYRGYSVARGVGLGACCVLAISTIYLAALPVAAIGLYAGIELRGRDRTRTLVVGLIAAILATLLLGPLLYHQLPTLSMRNGWLVSETPRTVSAIAGDIAAALFNQIAPLQERSAPIAYFAVFLFAVAAVALWVYHRPARMWLLWIPACLLPLGVMDYWGNKTHLTLLRYTLLSSPGVIGLIVSFATIQLPELSHRVRRLLFAIPMAGILYAGLSLGVTGDTERAAKEDWAIASTFARQNATPRTLYVVAAFGNRRWDHILYLGLMRYAHAEHVLITDSPSIDLSLVPQAVGSRFDTVIVFLEEGTPLPPVIPEGWTKTGAQKFPTVGTLMSYKPMP